MEGRVAPSSNTQGKLGLVVLAFKAGRLQNLSAPCAMHPGLIGTCTEDAVLTDATDQTKRHYIEAKTSGEIVCNDATCHSASYCIKTRWQHDDRTETTWNSMIGLLHPKKGHSWFRKQTTP
eukprot:3202273-Rhodomonas_salina.1